MIGVIEQGVRQHAGFRVVSQKVPEALKLIEDHQVGTKHAHAGSGQQSTQLPNKGVAVNAILARNRLLCPWKAAAKVIESSTQSQLASSMCCLRIRTQLGL